MTAPAEALAEVEVLAALHRFHGHVGPYVILGYRLGLRLLELLPAEKYHLRIDVACHPEPPRTCLLDGLQLASGCTMGKRDLTLVPRPDEPSRPPFRVTAHNRQDDHLVIEVEHSVPALFRRLFSELGESELYQTVMGYPAEQLWTEQRMVGR